MWVLLRQKLGLLKYKGDKQWDMQLVVGTKQKSAKHLEITWV